MPDETWKQFERNPISHSAAHHIIAIAELRESAGYARVSDVAKLLNITRGSASLTLKGLKKRGLVLEDENRFLRLSDTGNAVADAVRGRKFLLQSLLHDVLGVPADTAEEDTCKIEHLVSRETADRLARFLRFIGSDDERARQFLAAWGRYNDPGNHNPPSCPPHDADDLASLCEEHPSPGHPNGAERSGSRPRRRRQATPISLADLGVGQSGRIARVEGDGAIRQRFLDMGITRGAVVRVQRVAPLGDPIQVAIKGYSLAIRKSEAKSIHLELEVPDHAGR